MDNRTRAWIRAIRAEIDRIEKEVGLSPSKWPELVDEHDPRKPSKEP